MWMTHALCCRLKYDKFADSVLDCWRHYIGHFNRMQTVVNAFSARSCDEIAWRSCRIDTSDRQENMRTRARALTETRVGIGAHAYAHKRICTCICAHAHTRTHAHKSDHAHTHTHTSARARTHANASFHAHTSATHGLVLACMCLLPHCLLCHSKHSQKALNSLSFLA